MFTAYITLYYPFDDLEESGQNILIRSGGRQLWWLSKCLWNLTSVVVFFLLAWGVMVLGCLITGNSLSMEISPEMSKILVLDPDNYPSLPIHVIPQTFLLMPLVVAAINLLQMTVSLFVKPLISFIINHGALADFGLLHHPHPYWKLLHAFAQRLDAGQWGKLYCRNRFQRCVDSRIRDGRRRGFPTPRYSERRRRRLKLPKAADFLGGITTGIF